jgi:hypothetical protein
MVLGGVFEMRSLLTEPRGETGHSINGMVVTMAQRSSSVFLSGLLVLVLTAGAHAQGTQQQINAPPRGNAVVAPGGSAGTSGVATGSGPLSQPTAPLATPGNRQLGPTQTQPLQQQPFGR